jgi:hypothetical protein
VFGGSNGNGGCGSFLLVAVGHGRGVRELSRQRWGETRLIIRIDLHVFSSSGHGHVREPAVDEVFSVLGVDVHEDAVGGLSLTAVTGDGVPVVEMRIAARREGHGATGIERGPSGCRPFECGRRVPFGGHEENHDCTNSDGLTIHLLGAEVRGPIDFVVTPRSAGTSTVSGALGSRPGGVLWLVIKQALCSSPLVWRSARWVPLASASYCKVCWYRPAPVIR